MFAASHVTLTDGLLIGSGPDAPEQLAAQFARINAQANETVPGSGLAQSQQEMAKVMTQVTAGR